MSEIKPTSNSIDFQFTVDKKNYYLFKMSIFRFWIIGVLLTSFSLIGFWESIKAISELHIIKKTFSSIPYESALTKEQAKVFEQSTPFTQELSKYSLSPIPFTNQLDSNYKSDSLELTVVSQFSNPIEDEIWQGQATLVLAIKSNLDSSQTTEYLVYGSETTSSDFMQALESARYRIFKFQYLVSHKYKFTIPEKFQSNSSYTINAMLVAKINNSLHYGMIIEL